MVRKAARRADVRGTEGSADPSRPDNIPPQSGDEPESVVDITTGKEETLDVNQDRDDDARSDAEKDADRQREKDIEILNGDGEESDDEEEDRTTRRRRRGRRADPEEMSRDVARRINRERELRRRTEEEVSNVTAENQRLQERLARYERAKSDPAKIETSLKELKAKLEELKKKLFEVIEAGETQKQMELQIELGDVQASIKLQERDLEAAKKQAEADPDTDTSDNPGSQKKQQPKLVRDWLASNRKWWNLPSAEPLRKASIEIDKQIRDEIQNGDLDFKEYDEDHMDELTSRLMDEADRLGLNFQIKDFNGEDFIPDDEEGDEPTEQAANGRDKGNNVRGNNRGRAPQGSMGGREGRRKAPSDLELARQGKVRLTEADFQQMRVFKLNPQDPNARKAFAKERIRTILTDARKGGSR